MVLKFKKSTKILITSLLSIGFFVLPDLVYAANSLPAAVDGKITLTENVELTGKYVINEGETLTIDLAGYTLQGPSSDYAIDNYGNVTIVDNGATKGKIACDAPSSSCVRNFNTMEINGVTVDSNFIAVKSEPKTTLTVKDCTISSKIEGALLNAGNTTVENSHIKTTSTKHPAVYTTTGTAADDTSKLDINGSTLEGKCAINYDKSKRYNAKELNISDTNIIGSTHTNFLLSLQKLDVSISGTNKVTSGSVAFFTKQASNGTNIILTENAKKTLTIPEGVTLTIPKDVTLDIASSLGINGTLNVEDGGKITNANVYNESTNKYYRGLSSALSGAKDGNKIILQTDVDATSGAKTKAKISTTLDLNGKTITGDITNVANGTLTIEDNSENKTGKVDGKVTNNGVLTIEGGKYTVAPVTVDSAVTNINDGTYPIENIENVNVPEGMELTDNGDGTYSLAYKDADYSAVDDAIKKAKAINKSLYTKESLKKLDEAINAVARDKKSNEQADVDAMAKAILDAINNLNAVTIKNPDTADNILYYIALSTISLMSITVVYLNRKKLFKNA